MRLPGQRKSTEDDLVEVDPADQLLQGQHVIGKGRPTPRRSESAARRTGPPPPPPRTRKEAYQRSKERAKTGRTESKAVTRERMMSGHEEYLMPRDRGPVRRHVRQIVDSRRSITTWVLLVAMLVVFAGAAQPQLAAVVQYVWIVMVLVLIVDGIILSRRVRRELGEAFDRVPGRMRGHVGYALMRSLQFRRMRVPRPADPASGDQG